MAINQIQMGVNFRKNINSKSASYQKYYAEVDRQKTLTTRGLAAHLKEHNCMVGRDSGSAGEAVGVHTRADHFSFWLYPAAYQA